MTARTAVANTLPSVASSGTGAFARFATVRETPPQTSSIPVALAGRRSQATAPATR